MGNGNTNKNLRAKQRFNSWIDAIGLKVKLNTVGPHKNAFIDAIIHKIKENKTFFTDCYSDYPNKLNNIYQSSLPEATAVQTPEAVAVAKDCNATSCDSIPQSVSPANHSSSSSGSDSKLKI